MMEIVKCLKESCPFKAKMNHYCMKHKLECYINEVKHEGMKVCVNYIRGCRVKNPLTYRRSKCESCLKKDRELDHKHRNQIIFEDNKKQCTACARLLPLDQYIGSRSETKTCIGCRESNKRADLKRDKEHVKEISKKNAKKPERNAVKLEWKEKNHEKVTSYWIDARKRLIENDLEGFLKKNAENAKKWRESNPEKVLENNKNKTENIDNYFIIYKQSAKTKNLIFDIEKEYYLKLVILPCYYCGIIKDKGINGIDRLDSRKHYTKDNCVSCCEMCNRMKSCLSSNVFVHRVEHILTYLKLEEGKLYPDDFSDVKGCNYSQYKHMANKKNNPFDLSKVFFSLIQETPCYLCGKQTTNHHKNGLDRYDNGKGYTEDNVRPCCGNCNYMKKNYEYTFLIHKLKLIYDFQKINPIRDSDKEVKYIIKVKSSNNQENKIIQENRKKEQRNRLYEKYTNAETKKVWISEIVKKRLEK